MPIDINQMIRNVKNQTQQTVQTIRFIKFKLKSGKNLWTRADQVYAVEHLEDGEAAVLMSTGTIYLVAKVAKDFEQFSTEDNE